MTVTTHTDAVMHVLLEHPCLLYFWGFAFVSRMNRQEWEIYEENPLHFLFILSLRHWRSSSQVLSCHQRSSSSASGPGPGPELGQSSPYCLLSDWMFSVDGTQKLNHTETFGSAACHYGLQLWSNWDWNYSPSSWRPSSHSWVLTHFLSGTFDPWKMPGSSFSEKSQQNQHIQ